MVSINREPSLILGVVSSAVALISSFFIPLTDEQQGSINAAATMILGVVLAIWVTHEKLAPVLLGLLQALIALGISFGLHLDNVQQGVIMTFSAAVAAMFARQVVTAPVDHLGFRR